MVLIMHSKYKYLFLLKAFIALIRMLSLTNSSTSLHHSLQIHPHCFTTRHPCLIAYVRNHHNSKLPVEALTCYE
ncbi:hypothetical protein BDA96_03G438800 [Sorghum bicolor]|uniref:Uncharacterized protein n=2 Tax=Sorghum bicolor TaxID=4558 RepID=A0A921RI90_SORBI|nr:hypothetical protein BDA96_03G438800 [Sorghum bicolor]OQU88127.1 hypothetical protein SORBI_3003G406850 [Sorghum bicolor]